MARNAGYSLENNFVNGLMTEATGLNFPENAVTETDNCVFKEDGSVYRREGIDREDGFALHSDPRIDQAVSEYVWKSVAGDGNRTFLVQQTGGVLKVFNITGSSALSQNLVGTIDLTPYATLPSDFSNKTFQYATGLGQLLVVHPSGNIVRIKYDEVAGTFSVTVITIRTRDLVGVSPQPIGRLSTLTDSHHYNLLNQGWDFNKMTRMRNMGGIWPSDYDVWWLYKTPDALGTEVFLTDVAVNAGILNQVDRGNSPAPKGSIILDEFYQDRSAVSNVPGLAVVSSEGFRPSTVAFHAGRSFFSGVNYQSFSSKVYFSQIIESDDQYGRCYQQNDPTSQYSPDILPTDGGVISIPDAGTIYKLWSFNNSLLVFASNGVWEITGSSGIGFSATDYTVKKISSVRSVSGLSFVDVNGAPVWWGLDSIFAAIPSETGASITISAISDERIKTFYQDIPESSKVYAKGYYNTKTRVIQWLYRSGSSPTLDTQYSYNRILNFNTVSKAFYPWSLGSSSAVLKGIFSSTGSGTEEVSESVTTSLGGFVSTVTGEDVTVSVAQIAEISAQFKYLVKQEGTVFTYADLKEDDVGDWGSILGSSVIARAYFVTGYKIRGNAIKKAQSNYVRIYTEVRSVLSFHSRWDFANSGFTGRWSASQLIHFRGTGFDYSTRRIKVRGHGLAFQYSVSSYEREPFNVIGWASFDTANERS